MTQQATKTDTLFDALFDAQGDVSQAQENVFADFKKTGLPFIRQEAWKYTNLKPIEKLDLALSALEVGDDLPFYPQPIFEDSHKVFVLGFDVFYLNPDIQEILQVSEIKNNNDFRSGQSLVSLNGAFTDQEITITLGDNEVLDTPIEVFYFSESGSFVNGRLRVSLGSNASLVLAEHFASDDHAYSNYVTSIDMGDNARMIHYVVQSEDESSYHTSTVDVDLHDNADYKSYALSFGAALSRRDIQTHLNGRNAHSTLSGVNIVCGGRVCDATLRTNHMKPDCTSRQHYKTILKDSAKGVFQGKIYVERDAQKTDGYQLNNALLLSDKAEMNAKPELEIYADDVKCSHGATTGQIDEDALFYLRSRGITEDEARALMVEAFIGEVLEEIDDETVRTYFREAALSYMAWNDDEYGNEEYSE